MGAVSTATVPAGSSGHPQRPNHQLFDRSLHLHRRENPIEVPTAKYGAAFDVEDLGDPGNRVNGQQRTWFPPPNLSAASSTPAEASIITGVTPRPWRGLQPRFPLR